MFSSSELSSHQMAHPNLFRSRFPSKFLVVSTLRVPLQLKSCTRTSTLFSPTTPSGASVLSAFLSHSRLRIHVSCGSALPSSCPTSSFLKSPTCGNYLYGGGRMCFPVRDFRCLPGSLSTSPRFCPVVPRSRFAPGRPDVFPGRDCVSLQVHSSVALFC